MLFTIGYEGLNITEFQSLLTKAGVDTIIDVRETPHSRKKGFSKTQLRDNLQQVGIGYHHLKALGCPKPIRDELRQTDDWPKYETQYSQHLNQQTEAIKELTQWIETTSPALLCYEADHKLCHRSLVAQLIHNHYATPINHLAKQAG